MGCTLNSQYRGENKYTGVNLEQKSITQTLAFGVYRITACGLSTKQRRFKKQKWSLQKNKKSEHCFARIMGG